VWGADEGARAGQRGGGVWYFAYGSNLHPSKRRVRANLEPQAFIRALVRDWRLAFDMPGVPPAEPSMANLRPCAGAVVHGLLIHLSGDDFKALVRSEGSDHFYGIVELEATTYDDEVVRARAFVTTASRRRGQERPPSRRYMQLLREGARISGLDPRYCAYLEGLPHSDASTLARTCSALILDAYTEAAKTPLHDLGNHYLALLQASDDLAGLPRALTQAGLLVPGIGVGLGVRLLRRIAALRGGRAQE
jgi:hypothetical protein